MLFGRVEFSEGRWLKFVGYNEDGCRKHRYRILGTQVRRNFYLREMNRKLGCKMPHADIRVLPCRNIKPIQE
jgi:hypothetical protein